MAFPTSPSNNQVHKEGNRAFVYDSTSGTWDQLRESTSQYGDVLQGKIDAGVTGFTGIKHASLWRLIADFNGDANPVTNMEEDDQPVGFGRIGAPMQLVGGRFTFPQTGYWLIMVSWTWGSGGGDERQCGIGINTTINNSSYLTAAWTTQGLKHVTGTTFANAQATHIFDVTNTATHKCSVRVDPTTNVTSKGETTYNRGTIAFVRIGDT